MLTGDGWNGIVSVSHSSWTRKEGEDISINCWTRRYFVRCHCFPISFSLTHHVDLLNQHQHLAVASHKSELILFSFHEHLNSSPSLASDYDKKVKSYHESEEDRTQMWDETFVDISKIFSIYYEYDVYTERHKFQLN